MGKRLRKKQLLAEIEEQRTALDQCLALVPGRLMTKAGVTRGGWSVKDILGHLVEWQQINLDWYAAGQRGEKPAMPAPGYTLRELPRLNQMIYRKHHRRPLRSVLEDYHSYHARILALIESRDVGALLLDGTILDPERLFAGQYVSPLSLGTHSDQALVAKRTERDDLAFCVAW